MATNGEWDHWVRAGDFRGQHATPTGNQRVCYQYVKILNQYGGPRKCGYSITVCAGYYALHTFDPDIIGFLGADMNYTPATDGSTHIYGVGRDILRNDIPDPDRMGAIHGPKMNINTDQYITRLETMASERHGCKLYNLSTVTDTRLPYTKARPEDFE